MIINYPDEKKPLKDFCPGEPLVMVGELREICVKTDTIRTKGESFGPDAGNKDCLIVELKTGIAKWRSAEALAHPVKAEVVVK